MHDPEFATNRIRVELYERLRLQDNAIRGTVASLRTEPVPGLAEPIERRRQAYRDSNPSGSSSAPPHYNPEQGSS